MKKYFFTLFICLSAIYSNEKQNNDVLDVYTFKLDNGLTVYINEDHNTTSVFGAVVVKGGGKRDPKDATGIAHYLEHLLFKGTDQMGTIDYSSEKVFLDSIKVKYDELGKTDNEDERFKIQSKINELSIKAGDYAIPNEFDRIMEGIGGSWVNAYTSNDAIVYLNKIPGNQIEKWLDVYSHRFINPVFRLFQAELETVYEEKNRSMDNPFQSVFESFSNRFFKNHPYGQQTILGSVEHLKNPSLNKMQEYFDKYYVANNMALVLTGDIYKEDVIPVIKEKFSVWKKGDDIQPLNIDEVDFDGREKFSKRLTPVKLGVMGFRTVPAGHPDEEIIDLCTQLLTNESQTGLIDQLAVKRKIMSAGAFNMNFVDHGGTNFFFMPKLFFQSLNKAEKLLINEIEKIKAGDFDDDFFNAVKLTMKRQYEQNIESMEGRLYTLVNSYIEDRNWDDVKGWPQRIDSIRKEDVIRISNKYFGDNYLVMHSKMGFPKKHKLEKPSFKPIIPKNTEKQSTYSLKVKEIPENELNLKFIDFNNDVEHREIQNRINLYKSHNPINSIFNLTMEYGIGTIKKPILTQTSELLNLLGTETYNLNEFKNELQKIGTSIGYSADKNYFRINIKGFDEYLDESLYLLSDFFENVKGDDKKIKILIDNAKTERKMESKNPSTVGRALRDYVNYGENSIYKRRMTVKDIKKTKSKDYINSFKDALKYELNILYSGQIDIDDVKSSLLNNLNLNDAPILSTSPEYLELNSSNNDIIYFIDDKDAVQSQIYFTIKGDYINQENRKVSNVYNKYFSGGMSSIVFQEIREFRSLAYSSWANYYSPWYNNKKGHFVGYIGCQGDKTIEAIDVFKNITHNLAEKPERLEQVQSSLIKGINSKRPSFRSFPGMVLNWKKQGYLEDPRIENVNYYNTMIFQDIIDFQKKHIKSKPTTITILADKRQVSISELEKYGEVKIITKKEVMN